jgi:hypothetical protein
MTVLTKNLPKPEGKMFAKKTVRKHKSDERWWRARTDYEAVVMCVGEGTIRRGDKGKNPTRKKRKDKDIER